MSLREVMTKHEIRTALGILEEVMKCGDVTIDDIDKMLHDAFERDGQYYEWSVRTELEIEQEQVQADWENWHKINT